MPARLSSPAILFLATALAAVPAPLRGQGPDRGDSLVVTGTVLDASSGERLPEVRVTFVAPGAEGVLWAGVTDGAGWFASQALPAGLVELRAEAFGFGRVTQRLELKRGREVDVRIELVPEPLELPPLVVVSERRSRLEVSGFYERRRLGRRGTA